MNNGEKYVPEKFDYQYRSNKVVSELREKVKQLEEQLVILQEENKKIFNLGLIKGIEMCKNLKENKKKVDKQAVCDCGGNMTLEKELNCIPEMKEYNCEICHQSVFKRSERNE